MCLSLPPQSWTASQLRLLQLSGVITLTDQDDSCLPPQTWRSASHPSLFRKSSMTMQLGGSDPIRRKIVSRTPTRLVPLANCPAAHMVNPASFCYMPQLASLNLGKSYFVSVSAAFEISQSDGEAPISRTLTL